MRSSLLARLEEAKDRHEELAALMADPETSQDAGSYARFSKEYAELDPIIVAFKHWSAAEDEVAGARELLSDDDPELRVLAKESLGEAEAERDRLEEALEQLLMPGIRKMGPTSFSKFAPAPGAMKQPSSLAIFYACTCATRSSSAGSRKSSRSGKRSSADIGKWWCAWPAATAFTAS